MSFPDDQVHLPIAEAIPVHFMGAVVYAHTTWNVCRLRGLTDAGVVTVAHPVTTVLPQVPAFGLVTADGRDINYMHDGEYTPWEEKDINALLENMQRFGMPCITADFEHYDVNYESLKARFPKAKIIKIKGVHFRNYYGLSSLLRKK